jgi:hypothetical protein
MFKVIEDHHIVDCCFIQNLDLPEWQENLNILLEKKDGADLTCLCFSRGDYSKFDQGKVDLEIAKQSKMALINTTLENFPS